MNACGRRGHQRIHNQTVTHKAFLPCLSPTGTMKMLFSLVFLSKESIWEGRVGVVGPTMKMLVCTIYKNVTVN